MCVGTPRAASRRERCERFGCRRSLLCSNRPFPRGNPRGALPAARLPPRKDPAPLMRRTRIAAVAAALATTVPALAASNALAAGPITFNYTGAEQTYTVPVGTYFLSASAVGGRGGNSPLGDYSFFGGHGGRGARVAATLPVTPGQTLYVNVGGNGTGGANAPGGFNGGGGQREYGGGGAGG